MSSQSNIVVFTGNLAYSVRKGIVEIDRAIPGLSWLVVLGTPRKTPRQLLRNQWRSLRRNGWRWIPYQAGDVLERIAARRRARPAAHVGIDAANLEARANVRLLRVGDIHSPEALQAVAAFRPDLGLSLAAPILRRALFAIPRLGTLNLHKGRVPDYRGMPPAFWELWNDERSVGCTVHRVDDRLDTGDVVRRASVERAPYSTVRGLQLGLDEVGVELMRDAVQDVLAGRDAAEPQAGEGRTYRKPTLAQVAALEKRLMDGQTPPAPALKHAARRAGAALGAGLWSTGLAQRLAPRITVILYHRVSDDVRDNLTVGIEQFDRQMALVRKHCEVLSIEQVLERRDIPRSDRPQVAVTFDDGYLDNYAHAAPILLRHGIPAAFFVSTGIVDTADGRFPHDVRRGNAFIPLMSWDQLRRMRDSGFTIGSHSVSHIDCAAEPEETVRAELARSRDQLADELGISEPVFAYPYGGRQHMTPQRLELVRQAGYRGCLSAYGGTNVGTVDPYNVLRRGVHWEFSDAAFLIECLGLR